jgi:putative CocE/NonD family hydrolase
MYKIIRAMSLLGVLLALSIAPSRSASGEGTDRYEVTEKTVITEMNDGIRLTSTLVLPDQAGSYPAILVRTPYGRYQHLEEARFWASYGYAVVVQDARGKFDSEGEYLPFINEHDDGMATLDWMSDQKWCNGNIGMWGSSYLAFCQLVLASTGHPALKTIIPISGWLQEGGAVTNGGANHIMLSIPWILHEESQTKRSLADVDLDELFEYLPLIDVFSSLGIESNIWNRSFDFTPLEAYRAGDIRIPALHITGWNDFVHDSALNIYTQVARNAGSTQKLIVGPWIHDQFYTTYTEAGDEDFGPASAMGRKGLQELSLKWFDRTLKSDEAAVSGWSPVRLFVMGANEWKNYDGWPPSNVRRVKFYLNSGSGANSVKGDGSLSETLPGRESHDSYVFDPMNPVPTYGGANFHFFLHLAGVKDQREIEERRDVLVYTSPPLTGDIEIVGPIQTVLYAATEGRDTDFTAKLVEVRTGGYARIIEEGITRASYRNGTGARELLEPGMIYRLTVELGSTAIRIPEGHSIRLEISSSNFPKYDRNPNTGEDPLEAMTLKTVTQKIYHGGEYPSHVVLPVIVEQ